MEQELLEAINEMMDTDYKTIEEAKANNDLHWLLDSYLGYEGIGGYTSKIIQVMKILAA